MIGGEKIGIDVKKVARLLVREEGSLPTLLALTDEGHMSLDDLNSVFSNIRGYDAKRVVYSLRDCNLASYAVDEGRATSTLEGKELVRKIREQTSKPIEPRISWDEEIAKIVEGRSEAEIEEHLRNYR